MTARTTTVRRRLAALARQPMPITAVVGAVVTAANVWWVHRYRHLGAYNVDEVGYMATALRFHAALDPLHPLELVRAVAAPSSTGPLVPLLAVPLIAVFGRGVPVVMLVQPLLVVVAAVGAAGIGAAAAGRRAGVVAGVVTLCLPAMIQSARGFQYASAAAAFLAFAVLALLSSDHGRHRRWMLAFGAAVGLMLLSRTMAIGFVPALGVATVLQVRRDRRAWSNVGLAAAVALGVAAPWWIRSRDALYDHLFGLGYGAGSKDYGRSGIGARVLQRWSTLTDDMRAFRWLGLVILVLLVGMFAARRLDNRRHRGHGTTAVGPTASQRLRAVANDPLTTVGTVVLVGYLTLLTTRNQGVWFELPLEVLLVPLLVGLAARLPSRIRTSVEIAALCLAALTFGVSLTDTGGVGGTDPSTRSTLQRTQFALYGGLIDKERPLADADPALGSDDPAVRSRTAGRWWRANVEVAEAIERRAHPRDDLLFISVSGNSHLINGQSLLLTRQLRSMSEPPSGVPDTSEPLSELRREVEPTWQGTHSRLLVLLRARSQPFPEDRQVPLLKALAESAGWHTTEVIPLPDGGDVVLMEPPG